MGYTVAELLDAAPKGPGQLTEKCRIEQYVHMMGYTPVLAHLAGAISRGMSGEEARRILKEYEDSAPPLEYTPMPAPKLARFARLVRRVFA
jgi:hypothetical protein